MDLFIDNDVIIKLAEYDLLAPAKDILLSNGYQIYVLDSLPFVAGLNNPKRAAKVFTDDSSIIAVSEFLQYAKFAELSNISTFTLLESLDVPNLDAGELVLIGCAVEVEEAGFFSGDKRAISAINSCVENRVFELQHCLIILFEEAIKILLSCYSTDDVILKIQSKPSVDKTATLCFRGVELSTVQLAIDALQSYINHTQSHCDSLMFLDFELSTDIVTR